ncbi:MAG: lipid-A-disaccharide synthase [Microcoleaceae cyanobacterium]|jgi:lipid-A-disaccharide synthase
MARIFISTGEVSGDLQGAFLVEALKRQAEKINLDLEIIALGGSRMAKAGATILADTTGIGSVGILESIPYIIPTIKIQEKAKKYLKNNPPDVVVLIDYLGPNLGIGNYIRHHLPSLPIVWYIAPQEWVWSISQRNTSIIVGVTDLLLAIFPEEARYFEKKGANVQWVGHPLLERMQQAPTREKARQLLGIKEEEKAIALFPASRQQELKYLMPVMFQGAKILQDKYPEIRFFIPLSRENYREAIEKAIKNYDLRAILLEKQTLEIIAASDLAITKSGTVNLEIALLNVPQVVIYRVNRFTAWVAQHILKFSIPFMSPPNLVLMQEIVPELLQDEVTPENIVSESTELLINQKRREQVWADYQQMRQQLGDVGVCDRAALAIFAFFV